MWIRNLLRYHEIVLINRSYLNGRLDAVMFFLVFIIGTCDIALI